MMTAMTMTIVYGPPVVAVAVVVMMATYAIGPATTKSEIKITWQPTIADRLNQTTVSIQQYVYRYAADFIR